MNLSIDNVGKQYRHDFWALRQFSLKLGSGVFGLLGLNGAGKSTLKRILATITDATEGMITWDGVDIAKQPNEHHQVLEYLPQDFGVYPHLNAVEFLTYLAAIKGLDEWVMRRRIVVSAGGCLLMGMAIFLFGRPMIDTLRARLWKTDRQLAAQTAHEMIDYDLPPAYQEFKVLKMESDTDAVVIAHLEQPANVILIQKLPDGIVATQYQIGVEERWSRDIAEHHYDTHTVSTHVVVRGQSTTLRILEGTNEIGRLIRQAVCMFTSKSGCVLLVLVGDQDTWDQTLVEQFLQSIW